MADPITDIVIGEEIASAAGPAIIEAIYSIEAFFGYDGMQALYDILHGLGNISIDNIYPMLIFDGGQISGISGLIDGLTSEETVAALKGIKTVATIMAQKGIDLVSTQGKMILSATLEKIKEYGPGLTSAALGTYIGNQLVKYASDKGTQVASKIGDKITDKIGEKINLSNFGINN